MFGYVNTDYPNMYVKDTILYKAVYCGLCKSIGKCTNQRCRFCLNYDLTFLSAFLHNVCNQDFEVTKQCCAIHWLKKRPIASVTELSKSIASFNVILAYYKLCDDVIDNGRGRVKRSFIKKGYKKAVKNQPELDDIVKKYYQELRLYEEKGCDSIDMISDPFGNIIKDAVRVLAKEYYTENLGELCYNVGKWIYLIDALDDFERDVKKKNYNVFHQMMPQIKTKKELMDKCGNEIIGVFSNTIGGICELNKTIKYNFNHDLTDNIMLLGIKAQTKKIMEINK